MKLDQDGYPTTCAVCGGRLVKSAGAPLQFHYDHTAGRASGWHVRCGSPLTGVRRDETTAEEG